MMSGAEFGRPCLYPDTISSGSTPERSILQESSLRVSCASFARVQDKQGRYLLLANKNRRKQGKLILTPMGGAIEMTSAGRDTIKQELLISDTSFEKGNDLRFTMDGKNANALRLWFLTRTGRETDPRRELREELVDELRIKQGEQEAAVLTPNDLPDMWQIPTSFAGYQTEVARTMRQNQEGALTLRLLEIHDVTLPESVLTKLKTAEQVQPEVSLRFVTAEEIAEAQTMDGIAIGSVAKTLLNPISTIPAFTQ